MLKHEISVNAQQRSIYEAKKNNKNELADKLASQMATKLISLSSLTVHWINPTLCLSILSAWSYAYAIR